MRGKKMKIHNVLLIILTITFYSCNSEVEVSQFDTAPISSSILLSEGTAEVERIVELPYKVQIENEIASSCTILNLVKLSETKNCDCDSNGTCTVGVTGSSGESGLAKFDFVINVDSKESNTSTIEFEIVSSEKYFLYSSNNGSGDVSVTSYDVTTNKLTFIESSNLVSSSPEKMVVVGDNFYIAGNWTDAKISHFKINTTTGLLTKQADYTDAIDPRTLAVKGDEFLYAVNFLTTGEINKYKINADGSLSSHVELATNASKPRSIVVHPTLDVLYTVGMWSWRVLEFNINASTGELTQGNVLGTGGDPSWVELNHDGSFAYVLNSSADTMSVFSVNGVNGELTLSNTYSTVDAGPYLLKFNSDSSCMYINNYGDEKLTIFSNVGGVPTYISSEGFDTALGEIVIHEGKLFSSSLDGKVRAYNIETNCNLTLEDEVQTNGTGAYGLSLFTP
ncbi:MAG: 6-phosphogluconolactonase (cycloisomerase 2 family) [Bacteriovoracaceae bacterium]